jgi:O-antigen/teichoic acid export membrane protein
MFARIFNSVIAFYAGHVIITMGNLLLVPLYLKVWSPEVYGEWLSLYSLTAYLALFDFGITAAVYNQLTRSLAQGKLEEYQGLQHSAMCMYLSLAVASTLVLGLLVWFMPLTAWLGIKETPPATARWVVWLLGLQVLWTIPAGIVGNVYRTTGDLARSQWIGNFYRLLSLGAMALLLFLDCGMTALASSQILVLAGVHLAVYWHQRRRLPHLAPRLAKAQVALIRTQLRPGLFFGGIILANALILQGPVIILSAALGGAAVALFVTTRTLVNIIQQIVNALGHALWPELTILDSAGNRDKLRAAMRYLQFLTNAVGTALLAFLWFEGASIIQIWTEGRLIPDETLLRLLLMGMWLRLLWSPSSHLPAATNRHGKLAVSQFVAAVVGLAVAVSLVRRWGLYGPSVGLLVGEALTCCHVVIKDTSSLLGLAYGAYARKIWMKLLSLSALALVIGKVVHDQVAGPIFLRWGVMLAALFLSSLTASWLMCLNQQDRSLLTNRLKILVT